MKKRILKMSGIAFATGVIAIPISKAAMVALVKLRGQL